jgi:hypothetical protein
MWPIFDLFRYSIQKLNINSSFFKFNMTLELYNVRSILQHLFRDGETPGSSSACRQRAGGAKFLILAIKSICKDIFSIAHFLVPEKKNSKFFCL